jgi:hypothetical protein
VELENGEITEEPLAINAADDPFTCAIYAKEKGLLDQEELTHFKKITNRKKDFL